MISIRSGRDVPLNIPLSRFTHPAYVEKYLTFLLEKQPHAGMADEELEKLAPWSDAARAYCGFAQQIACI